jgi:hypothetical protein
MLNLNEILREYEPLYYERKKSNFNHVTRNLMATAEIDDLRGRKEEVDESLNSLKKYLSLLDKFPQFKELELAHNGCSILGTVKDYVDVCEERLLRGNEIS